MTHLTLVPQPKPEEPVRHFQTLCKNDPHGTMLMVEETGDGIQIIVTKNMGGEQHVCTISHLIAESLYNKLGAIL